MVSNKEYMSGGIEKWIIILFAVVVIVMIIGGITLNKNADKKSILYKSILEENTLYKLLLKVNLESGDVGIIRQRAEDYYSEASFFYEKQDYSNVESNSRLARTSYADASQGYKEISSMLKRYEIEDKLIQLDIESYDLLAEIQWNMYEACEHLESAVRYYNIYYNSDVSYDDMSYDMGTGEIDMMNEKIDLHDENIRKYNQLLSDFDIELESRLN